MTIASSTDRCRDKLKPRLLKLYLPLVSHLARGAQEAPSACERTIPSKAVDNPDQSDCNCICSKGIKLCLMHCQQRLSSGESNRELTV
jgi:hypothetical protein